MRKSCLECVAKHLGSAAVYVEECELGYPNYFGYAYGELCHASSECRDKFPDLAWAIREHRIRWGDTRNEQRPHKIPFEAMFRYIADLESLRENIPLEVPSEVLEGLPRNDKREVVYTMDTRP